MESSESMIDSYGLKNSIAMIMNLTDADRMSAISDPAF